MSQYQVDALRTVRSLQEAHARAGHPAQAEQMRRVGDRVEMVAEELAALRSIISEATAAIGNGSSCSADASIEFMAGLPNEIRLAMEHAGSKVKRLEQFIRNGVEFGYIQIPDAPDPALDTIKELCGGKS